ncbi:class I SAM-dependent methyltransferase [Ectothiorhodospira haloalkaliphila]|uniref:class I SAM-dependent methyltransferase n=1 Tax=Ectothiorhodospira haloalkaliphila TaxID=421628 RepID=UPI0004A2EE26
MKTIACDSAADRPRAEALARALGLELAETDPAPDTWHLAVTPERLELRQCGPKAPGPVFVDLAGGRLGYRGPRVSARKEPLARAVGIKGGVIAPDVVDATAGLGRDAFILALLGCKVTLLERHPVIAALLADGLDRAAREPELAEAAGRMNLVRGDAAHWLADHPCDVVTLDPMYPHRDKSALVKKEMRAFRAVVGDDEDAAQVLEASLQAARERVVVKRPVRAEPLGGQAPDFQIPGSSTRFDVYLTRP